MPARAHRLSPEQVANVIASAATGAAWAFEALYRQYAPGVVAYLRLQGVRDPEDLSSEVFLAVFKGLGRFSGGESQFRSWLFSIAYRKVVDDRRRASRQHICDGGVREATDALSGHVSPEETVLARMETERILRLCDALPSDQRDVILLRLVGDLSSEETAEAIGRSTAAVKALQHRGVARLKRKLLEEISSKGASQ